MRKVLASAFLVCICVVNSISQTIKPTPQQVEWANCEIGAIIHYDINIYDPEYVWDKDWDNNPSSREFNPKNLDTDQWIRSVKAMGAQYAVLVAKHCTGFSLWPTSAHEYSIKNSPYKNGKGDIVKEFIESCKKYGIKPGIYASASANGYLKASGGKVISKDPEEQKRYNKVVVQQLTELWTNYGKLFEIWFDGGVLPVNQGGPDVATLLHKYQPQAVVFQGPKETQSLIRWVGNERGVAPYPCWSRCDTTTQSDGTVENNKLNGSYHGAIWCPGEADFPIRAGGWQGGWFYHPDNTKLLLSTKNLVNRYYETVGRNTNMLIGIVINPDGLVPKEDIKRMKDFKYALEKQFNHPIDVAKGDTSVITMHFPLIEREVNTLTIEEDISQGQNIQEFAIEIKKGDHWTEIDKGTSIGHKYIAQLNKTVKTRDVRLCIRKCDGTPHIKSFTAYNCPKI